MNAATRFPNPARDWTAAAKPVLLSFDDGPDSTVTPRILDILARRHIKAVFFVLGNKLTTPDQRAILERASREGHTIGNHTWSHPTLNHLADWQIREEILKTEDLIGESLSTVRFFRPPYGAMDQRVRNLVMDLGYLPLLWNVDPEDWNPQSQPAHWVRAAAADIASKDECIVALHDVHRTTAEHLPTFLDLISSACQFPPLCSLGGRSSSQREPLWSYQLGWPRIW